jgi:micrococcal nuclease
VSTIADIRLRSKLYYYAATVTDVYDGDTFTVDIDLGLGLWRRGQRIRLWKVNTPEVRGAEREHGLAVRDYVRSLILERTVLLRTILDKRGVDSTEKYGRLLGEIILDDQEGNLLNLTDHLLAEGMGRPMTIGGATPVEEETAEPLPRASQALTQIHCPYCGEVRAIDPFTSMVAQCSNCLDGERSLRSLLDGGDAAWLHSRL